MVKENTALDTALDDFDGAFENANNDFVNIPVEQKVLAEEPAKVVEAAKTVEEPAKVVEPEKKVEEPAAEEPEKKVEEPAAEEPEKKVEEPAKIVEAEKKADSSDDLLEKFARIVQKTAAETKPVVEEVAAAAEPVEIYTAEEKEAIANYQKDWPDVAKAEALTRRAEYQQIVKYVFGEITKELMPLISAVDALSDRAQLSDIRSTVTDYDDVRESVIAWVGKQPSYLQTAFKHVIEQGTPDEVTDLIGRYKRENGVADKAAPQPAKKEPELSTATKQAAAALAPVSSKRSAVAAVTDPNDFESAFATFASKI